MSLFGEGETQGVRLKWMNSEWDRIMKMKETVINRSYQLLRT